MLQESTIDHRLVYFHGTSNKIEKLRPPSASSPFFVCGDIDYAYSYAFAGQVNGKTCFQIKQEKPGYVYLIELDSTKIKLFDALKNDDISKLARRYPKYLIESLKAKKWSIWSIFSYLNDYLFIYYNRGFGNVETFKKHLLNKGFKDFFDNNLFFNGFKQLIDSNEKLYQQIYDSNEKWDCLFKLIEAFNKDLQALGYNAFLNRENVTRVNENENRVITNLAIGIFDKECIWSGYPKAIPMHTVKNAIKTFDQNQRYGSVENLIHAIVKVDESTDQDLKKYQIIQVEGKDLEAMIPHLLPLIKKSYEKIGGKQGERTVDQLKSVQTMAQVVYDKGKILAFALAKKVHSNDVGNKLNLIGCDQTWKGKEAMQAIIKYNIDHFDRNVWCECSGAIEHWFKKYDGYPVSNQLVPEIIGEPRDKVWFHEDGYHYRRFLPAAHNRFVQKIMFGFVNEEVMQKTLNRIGYDIMRDKINGKIHEGETFDSNNNEFRSSFDKAQQFVSQLDKQVKDGTIDTMLPSIEEYLDEAIKILAQGRSSWSIVGRRIKDNLKPIKTGIIKWQQTK